MATVYVVYAHSSKRSKTPQAPARHHPAHKAKIFANGQVYLESHDGSLWICEINAFRLALRYLLDLGLVDLDTRLWIEGMKEPTSRIAECTWLRLPGRQEA